MPERTASRPVRSARLASVLGALLAAAGPAALAAEAPPATPPELTAAYDGVADTILAGKKAEASIVRSILATTYAHAEAKLGAARRAMKAGDAKGAQAAVEAVAALVGQLATEGDASIAAIRKRLLDGGHHHNAEGERQGIYDEGFVVVTRAAKAAFLESSRAFGQAAPSPKEDALDREWAKVQSTYASLAKK